MNVLDATCGDRGVWVDEDDDRGVMADLRVRDSGFHGQEGRTFAVKPEIQADVRSLPFDSDSFDAAVYDPPHVVRDGGMKDLSGHVQKKYGALRAETWQRDLRQAFSELWRVVRSGGTVSFKFADRSVPFERVTSLAPDPPLVGTTTTKTETVETRWFLFGVES
jgi:SAM-dependent methyltransferase